MTDETTPTKIQHEYVTDATFVPRMARTFIGFALTRPLGAALMTVVLVLGLGSLAGGLLGGSPSLTIIGVIYVLFPPVVLLISYLRTVGGNRRRVPVGSRIAVGLGPTTMRTEGPLGTSDTSYLAYRRAYRRGDFVILRMQGVRTHTIFPAELFPGSDFEKLRDAIDQANRRP